MALPVDLCPAYSEQGAYDGGEICSPKPPSLNERFDL
jgi:hypothetical protein